MFIGHYAVALVAKRVALEVSLGTLILAAQFLDGLWPVFLLLGWERVEIAPGDTAFSPLDFVYYPYSHSLLLSVVWAVLFAFAYWLLRKNSRAALWVGLAVFSHWILDFITHRPDLPLYPGNSHFVGLGLWNSISGTLVVEGLMFAAAVAVYASCTRAKDKTGIYAFWSFIVLLLALYIAVTFGPPPPSVKAIAWVGLFGMVLSVAWGYWIDRHRESIRL